MKKRITAIVLSALMLLSGCSSGADIVINADGYEGIILATEASVATAAPIPEAALTASDENDTEETDTSDSEDPAEDTSGNYETESSESEAFSSSEAPVSETASSVQTTTSAAETASTTTSAPAETTSAAASATSAAAAEGGTNSYKALNYSEVRGVWISYIELASILTGKTESQFTSSIRKMFQNCVDMGLNTVYVHVRAHGDAYYASDYFPWSRYITGTIGKTPSFDPLEIMVREAHALGLSFQAWINPYRISSTADIASVSTAYATGSWYANSEGDRVVAVGSYYYLNPGYSEAIDLIAAGAREVVAKYNVDGIHIDDYFYPTTDSSFDSKAYAASGYSSLSAFRTANCDKTVKAIYDAVKAANSSAVFGVSPQGNVQNNYDLLYADVKKWCSTSGYLDYVAPQIYFGFDHATQPYESVLAQWQSMVSGTNVKLIPGLAVYKIGEEDAYGGSSGKTEWINSTEIIKRQIESAMAKANYGGVILYSYSYVFEPSDHVSAITAEMKAVKSLFLS